MNGFGKWIWRSRGPIAFHVGDLERKSRCLADASRTGIIWDCEALGRVIRHLHCGRVWVVVGWRMELHILLDAECFFLLPNSMNIRHLLKLYSALRTSCWMFCGFAAGCLIGLLNVFYIRHGRSPLGLGGSSGILLSQLVRGFGNCVLHAGRGVIDLHSVLRQQFLLLNRLNIRHVV